MNIAPAGDGWRVVTDCADRCGAVVVCMPSYIGRARCGACARVKVGAVADGTRVPVDRPAASMPSRLVAVAEPVQVQSKVRRGFVGYWPDDVPMPAAAVGFVELLRRCVRGGAQVRVVRTIAAGPTGALVETCGVHWRGGVAFWTRHETPRVRHEEPRKVDLTRTATGRRRVLRFDPKVWWTGGVTWAGEAYSPVRLTVTQATKLIMERYTQFETGV